jgi:hypothetical protein
MEHGGNNLDTIFENEATCDKLFTIQEYDFFFSFVSD